MTISKLFSFFLLLTTLLLIACQSDQKPANILYINIDDLGWTDLGFQGSEFYETPNIDRLASQSVVFTQAYAPASNCAPSRASCLTGESASRHGIYTVGSSERGKSVHRKIIPVQNQTVLKDEKLTIAEVLKQAGYTTAHIGKWHLGDNPQLQGFDINIGGSEWGHPKSYFSPYKNPALEDGPEGEYLTDRLTEEAVRFLESHSDKPFFLQMAFYTVHTPLQAVEERIRRFEKKSGNRAHFHPVYAAMIQNMDWGVSKILETLNRLNLSENTFVLLTSDNGGVFRHTRQWPLRAGKGSYYEGGVRVPLIIQWPGRITPGTRIETPVSGLDYYPTFLEVAGLKPPEDKRLDGVSLVPVLTGRGSLPDRPLFWHFPIYLENGNRETRDILFRTRPGSVVRYGDWKLHEYFESGGIELYNLAEDLGEQHDLSSARPEKVAELLDLLKRWRQDLNAPIPADLNPEFDPDSEKKAIEKRLQNIDY